MTLPGIDPLDPTPRTARNLIFGASPGGSGTARDVLLYGNKTAAGTATVDVIGDVIASDADASNRFGPRSELYRMYRSYVAIDKSASIYAVAIPESAGTAASCILRVNGTSDATTEGTVTILGENITFTMVSGDTDQETAESIRDAINNYDEGRLPLSAASAQNGSDWDVTLTAANKGPRGDFVIGNTAKRGVRISLKTSTGTNAQTIVKKTFIAGATGDDATNAILAASQDEKYYHIAPFHTDNGAGASATYADAAGTSIIFADVDPDTITRDSSSWITDGYVAGMSISINNSVSNDGVYLINSVSALVITLDPNEKLTAETLAAATLTSTGKFGLGATTAVSPSDNQMGELVDMIKTQAMPVNGKSQIAIFGQVGTNSQAIAVPTDSDVNSVRGFYYWEENSDWTPGMLAAYHGAIHRSGQIAHPSKNLAGYTSTDNTSYAVPAPFDVNDRPTDTEIKVALNNGVSPIKTSANGRTSLVRQVTSRSESPTGDKDYRARSAHITSAVDFFWSVVETRWEAQKQEFVAGDPAEGELPTLNTTIPRSVAAMVKKVIDDLSGSKPLGIYNGPILAPDMRQKMKDSVIATKIPAGINVSSEVIAVQHLYKFEGEFLETGEAY